MHLNTTNLLCGLPGTTHFQMGVWDKCQIFFDPIVTSCVQAGTVYEIILIFVWLPYRPLERHCIMFQQQKETRKQAQTIIYVFALVPNALVGV